ncbi:Geranylgeranyl diphosphate reductase, chloroplastic [Glycine soja]|nr:Geranylgeranyl diphosphate reductase, chloroplastic [Glycine soja]
MDIPKDNNSPYVLHYSSYDGKTNGAGEKRTLEVDAVIGADGANSRVAKSIDAGDYEYAIAFQERVRIPDDKMVYYENLAEMYVGDDVSPDFYGWVFPKCDHVAVGTGTVTHKGDIKKFQLATRKRAEDKILGGKIIRVEAHPIPEHPRPRRLSGRVALVGDAAGYVTKCSGEGIYFAAKSGRMCAEAIVEGSENGKRMVEEGDLRKYLEKWDKTYWPTYKVLDILQKVFYRSNPAREAFVEMCADEYVQKMTFDSYLYKTVVPGNPLEDLKLAINTIGSLVRANAIRREMKKLNHSAEISNPTWLVPIPFIRSFPGCDGSSTSSYLRYWNHRFPRTGSLGQRGSSLPQSKSFGLKFNSLNHLKSFCGLKAMSSVRCESESSFFGNKTGAALRASFASKAQKENNHNSQPQASYKVAVLGAAGGIGQPLSLLIKMSPLVSNLHLYDIANVKGVAADISHCNTPSQVRDFTGASELPNCLKDVNVVVIPAGVPRKPGMTRDDLFNINAGIVRDLVSAVADYCPDAFVQIISNPVNSTVPIAAEVLKQKGVYDPKKLFGVTTLDVVRANTFVAQRKNLKLIDVDVPVVGGHAGITILPLLSKTRPSASFTDEEIEELTVRIQNAGTEVVEAKAGTGSATLSMAYLDVVRANTFVAQRKNLKLIDVDVPVVGGHAGITILPLLSKTRPSASFTDEEIDELTVRIQSAGTEVVEAKAGTGSATLSMAYAAARFVESSLRALDGDGDVYECSFVESNLTDLPFFASRVKLGRTGVEALIPSDLQGLTDYEQKALEALKPELKASIEKGIAFAQKQTVAA